MKKSVFAVILLFAAFGAASAQKGEKRDRDNDDKDKKACFTREARAEAERNAHVYFEPDPSYDPVLGYSPRTGPHKGAPPVDPNTGFALPINCVANPKDDVGKGTLPKFYCSVDEIVDDDGDVVRFKIRPHFKGQARDKRNGEAYGEFLGSRFSQAMGFYAHDAWVADVTCPDCDISLTKPFQGAKFTPFQPAAGVSFGLGEPIEVNCNGDESASLGGSLDKLIRNPDHLDEIDAFKLWLGFIDHGDTKSANQRFACLRPVRSGDTLTCAPDDTIFFVSDMGSTFGSTSASEKKATLAQWQRTDPIKIKDGRCYATAKNVGDSEVGEPGRQLLARNLQRLLDAEAANGLITRVFKASRNSERDQPAEAWTAEFVRRARMIINARCAG